MMQQTLQTEGLQTLQMAGQGRAGQGGARQGRAGQGSSMYMQGKCHLCKACNDNLLT